MATQVKCIYEDGIFRPVEELSLGEHLEVTVTIELSEEELKKELVEGYTEMAAESRKEAEEWLVTERELEEVL